MSGSIPAPTLRVGVGDTLRIRVVNQLPANPPTNEPTKHLRYPNSTNLHTHGLHVTPGMVSPGDFSGIVKTAAGRVRRPLQIVDVTGAAPDHPVMANCPESEYLKAIWARVL